MRVVRVRLAAAIVLFLIAGASAAEISFVPWKVLIPGDPPVKAPLTLFWVPASGEDFKRSDLLISRPLTVYASQCVGMQVIRTDDAAMIARLGVAGALPAAVLVAGDGREVAKVGSERGELRLSAVERMLRDALRSREAGLDAQLDDDRKRARAGDRDAAVELYKTVWDQRCLFPRKARVAQRELKRLGFHLEN
jgi:hypothetical protein